MGKPHPGFWLFCWGYFSWFSGVSAKETVEPSEALTGRPWSKRLFGAWRSAAAEESTWREFVDTYLSGSEADYQAAVRRFAEQEAK